jgi:nucleotide-binding universal stress UspA family protein
MVLSEQVRHAYTELRRILCPVDFSEQSTKALRLAGAVGEIFGAEVIALHAQQIEFPTYFTLAQTEALGAQLRQTQREARRYLENYVDKHFSSPVKHSIVLKEGDPATEILAAQKDFQAGLVVMGTHGWSGFARVRLGSVMESVLRVADVPVLSVGPRTTSPAASGAFHRILCPVDLQGRDRLTCDYAAEFAEKTAGELIVLHVVEETSGARPSDEAFRQKLCEWVAPAVRGRCTLKETIRRGTPSEQIVKEAEASGADLVVVGAYPRRSIETVLFGTTTEALVRIAPCPVLTIVHK